MSLDLDYLLKMRLVVGRFGELDIAKWWNTKGQLGRLGSLALRRGFPRTHHFAQARSVFAVATHRCREVFDPPGCYTLWWLPESIEDEFDARWEHWLDHASDWHDFFERLEVIADRDLITLLQSFGLVTDHDLQSFSRLRRSAEGRAVPLPGTFGPDNTTIALLASAFARGEPEALAVPYIRSSS